MNNERYNQIIDEVYGNFIKSYTGKDNEIILPPFDYINDDGNLMSKNQFITNIKYDYWFSETWGLKIKEHILTFEERHMLWDWEGKEANVSPFMEKQLSSMLDKENIPTKIITITYNNEKIESYE
jgi:sensor histidine kinase YesM